MKTNPEDLAPINTPENVPRLFCLVTPKEARFAPAFYQALQNTLVAKDLTQANRIAFGKKRWRVVTMDGKLVDISGTMSGGGSRVAKGLMSSSLVSDITPEALERLEKDRSLAEEALRSFLERRHTAERDLTQLQT